MITRLLSPKRAFFEEDLRDAPPNLVVAPMANGLHLVGLAGSSALVRLRDPTVPVHMDHLARMRLLDGDDVVPHLAEDCRQLPRAPAGVLTHEE